MLFFLDLARRGCYRLRSLLEEPAAVPRWMWFWFFLTCSCWTHHNHIHLLKNRLENIIENKLGRPYLHLKLSNHPSRSNDFYRELVPRSLQIALRLIAAVHIDHMKSMLDENVDLWLVEPSPWVQCFDCISHISHQKFWKDKNITWS